MYYIKYSILAFLFLATMSCQSDRKTEDRVAQTADTNLDQQPDTTSSVTHEQKPDVETTLVASKLRPGESILIDHIYTDTIVFGSYNDDYDYFMLEGKKNGTFVSLIYNWDHNDGSEYDFEEGEIIELRWKMDSIEIASEGTYNVVERSIDARSIKNYKIESNILVE